MKKLALLIFVFTLSLPALVHAASLININTADAVLLETLPGIGPTKAAAIIGYRSENGPFATIDDIQNVSGIGPVTFANIEALIATSGVNDPDPTPDQAASTTATTSVSETTSASTPAPAPASESGVIVDPGTDRTVIAGADATYTANVTGIDGSAYQNPEVHWTWGDGSSAVGQSVLKSYQLPGTYLVAVNALASDGSGSGQLTVTVKDAQVSIPNVSSDGITVTNGDTTDALDLSYWQLSVGASLFTFPSGTKIAAGGSVTFSPAITGLNGATTASLLYPSGKIAITYEPAVPALRSLGEEVQPSPVKASSHIRTNVIAPANAPQPARAPAASTQVAVAGAALSLGEAEETAVSASSTTTRHAGLTRILESPWTLSVLGVLAFSGAALIVL